MYILCMYLYMYMCMCMHMRMHMQIHMHMYYIHICIHLYMCLHTICIFDYTVYVGLFLYQLSIRHQARISTILGRPPFWIKPIVMSVVRYPININISISISV